MLYGFSLLYGATGSVDLATIAQNLGEAQISFVFVVAAIVLIATVFPVKNYLDEQHIQDQIRLAQSGDPANISRVLEALPELNFADQGRLLVEAREPILSYYENQINRAVDLDAQANLMEAVDRLLALGVRRLLVEEEGEIVGVIREQDIFFEMANLIRPHKPSKQT